ncbi:polysaccharide pyruvyl transferase family protein [bacterium]|nr:polysaccharide pyruvyl transferase family protein [bacterium]
MNDKVKKLNEILCNQIITNLKDLPKKLIFAGFPVPELSNVGDYLIAAGLIKLFRILNIEYVICKYGRDLPNYDLPILIRGGEYSSASLGMRDVFKWFFQAKNRKIIFAPTSFVRDFDKHCALFFELPKIEYVCFREKTSKEYFEKNLRIRIPTKLVPCPSILLYNEFENIIPKNNILIIYPNTEETPLLIKISSMLRKYIKIRWLWNDKDKKILNNLSSKDAIEYAKEFAYNRLCEAKLVISNRMHGSLIPAILGINVISFNGLTHKVKSFYNTYLKNYPNIKFVENNNDLENLKWI